MSRVFGKIPMSYVWSKLPKPKWTGEEPVSPSRTDGTGSLGQSRNSGLSPNGLVHSDDSPPVQPGESQQQE